MTCPMKKCAIGAAKSRDSRQSTQAAFFSGSPRAVIPSHWLQSLPTGPRTMAASDSHNRNRRHRGLSISFDQREAEWVDALVDLLKQERYPKAGRSEVVRVALLQLQDVLAGRSRSDIVKFFAQRDADHFVATVDGTKPRLPSS
jgi:hypothetical protein